MKSLKYKGYRGSIEYSEENKHFYGEVLGMTKDCILYEGNTVEELENDFKEAIDSYAEGCREMGMEPRKPENKEMDRQHVYRAAINQLAE